MQGMRPLNPLRDLSQVADLVELVFGQEESFTGAEVIAEMRQWAARAPLLLLLSPLDSAMTGFVWEEDGRIVGNVSVGRLGLGGRDWLISNVAVHPNYRRRGIARQLVEAALALIAGRGGGHVVLQVRQDNQAALDLYRGMGFARFATTIELHRPPRPGERLAMSHIPGSEPLSGRHASGVMRLMRALLTPEERPFRLLLLSGSQLARDGRLESWISDRVERRRTRRLVVRRAGQVVALLVAQARLKARAYHRLFLAVHPGLGERLEGPLVQQGLAWLAAYPASPVLAHIPATWPHMYTALLDGGFQEIRRMEQMKLRMMHS